MKSAQSSGVWFQPASTESAVAPVDVRPDVNLAGAGAAASITAIAHLEVGRLAEARHVARDPVGYPIDHGLERNKGIAE